MVCMIFIEKKSSLNSLKLQLLVYHRIWTLCTFLNGAKQLCTSFCRPMSDLAFWRLYHNKCNHIVSWGFILYQIFSTVMNASYRQIIHSSRFPVLCLLMHMSEYISKKKLMVTDMEWSRFRKYTIHIGMRSYWYWQRTSHLWSTKNAKRSILQTYIYLIQNINT